MDVVILHSELSGDVGKDEQDVLVQVELVSEILREMDCEVYALPFSSNLAHVAARLQEIRPDMVFNLVETVDRSGRLIHIAPALLDHLGISYTGAPTEAAFLTSNKMLSKKIMAASGILTPNWFDLPDLLDNVLVPEGYYVIKSLWEHASVGLDEDSIIYARHRFDLIDEMERRRKVLGGSCFAEAFIEGREFNLSLLAGGNKEPFVLPPAEIRFDGFPECAKKVVGYRAKWETDSFEYLHTPRCFDFPAEDGSLLQKLKETAQECWFIFELRGYARVDFRVDQSGTPWVLEVNTNPCLSPDAGFVAASKEAGLSLQSIVKSIMEDSRFPLNLHRPAGEFSVLPGTEFTKPGMQVSNQLCNLVVN